MIKDYAVTKNEKGFYILLEYKDYKKQYVIKDRSIIEDKDEAIRYFANKYGIVIDE
jgi:hypothetical protein